MLLMVEKGTRKGIYQVIQIYAKANNKYMKNYDKNTASAYLLYLDANNFYGWTMSQKLPLNSFEWVEDLSQFREDFLKNYDEIVIREIFFKQMLSIQKIYLNWVSKKFLPKRKKIGKCNKFVCDFYGKKNYVVYIKDLKQALNHGSILKKVHRVTQFNQKAWMKPYIVLN